MFFCVRWARILLWPFFQRFVVDPKVTRSTFTGVFLCALGSNPAAVPLFRMRFSMASKGL